MSYINDFLKVKATCQRCNTLNICLFSPTIWKLFSGGEVNLLPGQHDVFECANCGGKYKHKIYSVEESKVTVKNV